jgi:hypothetical protein
MEKKRGLCLSRRKRRTDGRHLHPNGSKTPSGVTRPIGASRAFRPWRAFAATPARGFGGFALGFVVDERSARDSRRARGRRAVAPRTVLEHLQQREGRDLDVLRGVHLRGIPRGRLGSAPHHTPATHHPGDVHRARFTCAWPVRVRREVDRASETRSDELCEIERNSSRVKSVSTVCVGARNQLSLATEKLTLGRRLGTCVLPRPALSAHCVASGSGTAHDVTTRRPRRARAGHGRRRA